MTWRLAIRHTTVNAYAQPVAASYNEARLTPPTVGRQRCTEARVEVRPSASIYRYVDYWGTVVDSFDLHTPHVELVVTGFSVVETQPADPVVPSTTWELLADPVVMATHAELLAGTSYVDRSAAIDDLAASLRRHCQPGEAALAAATWVRSHLDYSPGATDVSTSATEAMHEERGVCQDFAHLTLALLRAMGIPARYASGISIPPRTPASGRRSTARATPGSNGGPATGGPGIRRTAFP